MKILDIIAIIKFFGHWSIIVFLREKINKLWGGSGASHIFAVVSGSDLYFDLLYSDFIKEQWHRFLFLYYVTDQSM